MTTLTYRHPQGSTIVVHDNGTMTVTDARGKPKKTSATPEKLAAGHGGWALVPNADTPPPPMPDAPPGGAVRPPMRFAQATWDAIKAAVASPAWCMQQKLDGVRGQLVVGPDGAWARASGGGPLKSTVAGPIARKVIDTIKPGQDPIVLDGEILNGEWWMFDIVPDETNRDDTPYRQRLDDLAAWVAARPDLSPLLRVLPTAHTETDKDALLRHIIDGDGEGVLIKRLDAGYTFGARVDHSLKYKVTHTVDAVVMSRDNIADCNATLGVYDTDGTLTVVGSASMIGKPDAQVGQVLEVRYLYAGSGGRLVQPTVLRLRDDKDPRDCGYDQLVFADKTVIEEIA